MSKQISVTDETYRQFQAALILTGEEEENVLRKLLLQYAHDAFEGIVGEKNGSNSSCSVQPLKKAVSEREQKMQFTNWFKSLARNGKSYNPITICGYSGRIENACSDPVFESVPVKNLFAITDLSQYLQIQKQIKSCEGYSDFDAKAHNGFTAALRKYEEFLRFQESGMTMQNQQSISTPVSSSEIHRWTEYEDEICCKMFLGYYVINRSTMEIPQFLQMLQQYVPDVPEGSLRMKIQNIKYLVMLEGLEDTAGIKGLSQYSMQCERAFKSVLSELKK